MTFLSLFISSIKPQLEYIIMLTLTRKLQSHFSRRTSNQTIPFQALMAYKFRRLKKYSQRYDSSQHFQHQDKLFQEYVYGHSCRIVGSTQNSFQSQKLAKSAVKHYRPNLLIFGGISDNFLRYHEKMLEIRGSIGHPILKSQKLICRQRIAKVIQTRFEKDQDFFWDNLKKEIFIINHKDRRIMPSDYMTIAHMAATEGETRMILGKPSDTLVFQDLIMRFSVKELTEIVERTVDKARQRHIDSSFWQQSFTLDAIQNYAMSDEPEIYSRQITYQTAVLKRFAKIQDNIVMLAPGYFVQRIAEQVHQNNIKPENVFRDGINDKNSESYANLQKILTTPKEEILEKFALISLLKQNWLEKQLGLGTNVFSNMCFGSLFAEDDIDELRWSYLQAKERVSTKWYELMKHRINNVHITPQRQVKMDLEEQYQVLEKRAKKDFPYFYQEKNYVSVIENKVKLAELQQKMKDILNEQNDPTSIEIFDAFLKGQKSKQGIIIYSKLLGKANIQSADRIRLPVFHYAAFRGIYKEYLRDFILKADENSKIQIKLKKKINKIQQLTQKLLKKLDNPNQLQKYLSGKKGKIMNFNFDHNDGPTMSTDQISQLQQMVGQMSPQDEKDMKDLYGADWDKQQEKKN